MLKAGRTSDWMLGGFGFALMAAYWPGIAGVATTPRWDVAALLTVVLFVAGRVRMTAVHVAGALLAVWLLVSLSWSGGQLDGVDAAFKLVLVAVAFAVGSLVRDLGPLFVGAALGLALSSGVVIAQWLGWNGIETFSGVSGLFFNCDRLAAAAAMVGVGLVAMGRPLMAVVVLPCLLLPASRAAWLAAAAGLMLLPTRLDRYEWPFWLRCTGIAGAILTLLYRYGDGSAGRIALWRDTLEGMTVWGRGLGSFMTTFTPHLFNIDVYGIPDHPHNEILWLAYEGGIPALVLGAAFVGLLVRAAKDREEGSILVALAVLGLFAMPLHDPATAVLGALVAGRCAAYRRVVHGVAVDRGGALRAGLAAG